MAVISPEFAMPDPSRLPGAATGPAAEHAPSVTLPLRYILAGLTALVTGVGLLVARPELLSTYHYNQQIIAVTHLFVLGFALSIVVGAMYQLVPVALETRLWSERLGRWQFPLHAIGVAGMVTMFWVWNLKEVGHFGSALALGVGLFIYNLARTMKAAPRRDGVWLGLASVLVWLGFTILTGLYLATSKCWDFSPFATIPAMHAHAHAGVLGVFLLLILTVSYKLIPMFVLSRVQSERRVWWSIQLFNAGLAGLFVTLLLDSVWKLAFAGVLLGSLGCYTVEMRAILRARLRRQLDWGLRTFLVALGLLVPLAVLAVVLCWPGLPATMLTTQLENVYGFLGVLGVVGLAIIGMLHKIAPFLVWFHTYSPRVGYEPVPSLSDLYSARIQQAGFWSYLAGLLVTSAAVGAGHALGVRAGAVLLAVGLLFLGLNLGAILSHWFKPRRAACSPSPNPIHQPVTPLRSVDCRARRVLAGWRLIRRSKPCASVLP
jgi:hypothetical protein